jgi:hypothetical protein
LFPSPTNFKTTSPCHNSNRDRASQRELPNGRQLVKNMNSYKQPWRILKLLIAYRHGHRQIVHITSPIASITGYLTSFPGLKGLKKPLELPSCTRSKPVTICLTDVSIARSRVSQPTPNEKPGSLLDKTLKRTSFQRPDITAIGVLTLLNQSRLHDPTARSLRSPHVVGNLVCLVMLWYREQ